MNWIWEKQWMIYMTMYCSTSIDQTRYRYYKHKIITHYIIYTGECVKNCSVWLPGKVILYVCTEKLFLCYCTIVGDKKKREWDFHCWVFFSCCFNEERDVCLWYEWTFSYIVLLTVGSYWSIISIIVILKRFCYFWNIFFLGKFAERICLWYLR